MKTKIIYPRCKLCLFSFPCVRDAANNSNAAEFVCRVVVFVNRGEKIKQLFQQPDIITTGIDEVSTTAKPLVRELRKVPAKLKELMEMIPHQEA